MATLTRLGATGANISDLTGLGFATNLTYLNLFDNSLSDISPVAGLTNLTSLELGLNRISDISPVVGLTNLTWLALNNNSLSDISAVAGLTNLTNLGLNDNPISDISAVAGLTNLTLLALNDNSISDISPVAGLLTNLTNLGLGGNSLSDISVVAGLTNLTSLALFDNSLSDISSVAGLTNLTVLALNDNSLSDISAVAGLTNLTLLILRRNSISDISPLVANTGLGGGDEVDVRENPLSYPSIHTHIPILTGRGVAVEFDNFSDATEDIPDPNLRAAIETALGKASGATITDAEMVTLNQLTARNANISDLTGLEFATNLTLLILWDNSISDISPVAGLTNLTWLEFGRNRISDISAVAGLTNLTVLALNDNSISDISPLVANTGLGGGDTVNVRENPLSYPSIHTHIPTLTGRGVAVWFDNRMPTTLLKISGAVTSDNLLVVEVRDSQSLPFEGVAVTFTVTSGGGTLSATSTTTNANGRAESQLTLGSDGEPNTVRASVEEITQTVTFSPTVDIPDPNLRAAIETALGKASGATITGAEMATLNQLNARNANISDLTGLEFATNLTVLILWDNSLSDISPVAGLTNLTSLYLSRNSLSDISAVAGLTNLTVLALNDNSLSDISPLVANTGLGGGDTVNVRENPLSYPSIRIHIPTLTGREVTVRFDNRTPTTLLKISGAVTVSDNLLVVEVRDSQSLPFEGVAVTFTVTSGGGTLSATSTTTNANGRAESRLTLGSDGEPNTVRASFSRQR